jgi:hypothetical protein
MANTFELIASSTVGSGGAANIDFTSIPATFTDLCLSIHLVLLQMLGDDYLVLTLTATQRLANLLTPAIRHCAQRFSNWLRPTYG